MKYVLLFCGTQEDADAFGALSPDDLRARYAQVGAWFAEHRARIGPTNQLQGPETATSVRFGPGGPPVVTDGPFLEGKERPSGAAARPGSEHLWNHVEIAEACQLLVRAGAMRRPGPYQLQAAIIACHAEAPSWAETDWLQIVLLYDGLLRHTPSPVIRLHRAIAVGHVFGAAAALDEVDALAADLRGYHLFHATRAELLRTLGRTAEAREADEQALRLTDNPAERALLELRLA